MNTTFKIPPRENELEANKGSQKEKLTLRSGVCYPGHPREAYFIQGEKFQDWPEFQEKTQSNSVRLVF
jgi:hypothetical protein